MIVIKNKSEIEYMRKAGAIVGKTLSMLEKAIKPGISTKELDKLAEEFIKGHGAKPSFKGYYGFPASICTSVNEVVIHGIPSDDIILKEGDIISIDCGAIYRGYHGDAARTFPVGEISDDARKIIDITKESFFRALKKVKTGGKLSDIGSAVQQYVEANGYSIVRNFVGHGVGRDLHEDPEVPNFYVKNLTTRLRNGMTLAIEPMVNAGTYQVDTLDDGWTVVTRDRKLSAHYENTVAIFDDKIELLTLID